MTYMTGPYGNTKTKRGSLSKVRVNFDIDEADAQALGRTARRLDMNKSEAFRQAVKQWLEAYEPSTKP